jgi:hypothetical protein
MRVIVRRERPHRGAQLRIIDGGGHRLTVFATQHRPWRACPRRGRTGLSTARADTAMPVRTLSHQP